MTRHEYLDRILPRPTAVPMLPASVLRIIQMAEDPLCSPAELSRMIEADQGIATKVLTLANLPFHGQRHTIMSVPMAVTMLGTSTLKYALLSAAVSDMFRTGGTYFNMPALWKHSVATATAARILAEQVRYPKRSMQFTAGLLHDIGKIVGR